MQSETVASLSGLQENGAIVGTYATLYYQFNLIPIPYALYQIQSHVATLYWAWREQRPKR